MNEQQSLMKQLQIENFTLIETALFLDSHPDDRQALDYYEEHLSTYGQLVDQYEATWGPLTICSNYFDSWKWVEGPWPWELEGN